MSRIKKKKSRHGQDKAWDKDIIDGQFKVTEWQPRDGKRKQSRQRTRWWDEIGCFAGVNWNRQAADRDDNDDDDILKVCYGLS